MRKGRFIVIEAIDAGGSQTQTGLLVQRLRSEGYQILQLHFPQEDYPTGQLIYRKFLHAGNRGKLSRREQALLYIQDFFSRAGDINHALRQGHMVVSDRFCTSTMAYQTIGLTGGKRRQLLSWIKWLCWQGRPQLPNPTTVMFIDTPVAISLNHLVHIERDLFENATKLTAIRASYLRLAQEEHWTVINGVDADRKQRSKQDIHDEVWQHVQRNKGHQR